MSTAHDGGAAAVRTARLDLVPFAGAHCDGLWAFFRDPHVRRYLLDGAVVERAWVAAEIEASIERFAAGGLGLFVAADRRGDGALVGVAGFRPDHVPPVMELIYALDPAWCGRGLATEMARAMVELAFHGHGWPEVRAAVDAPNRASIRVLDRLGFVAAGESPGAFGAMSHRVLRRSG